MHQAYRLSIFYFSCFALLLLVSAVTLFISKIGFSLEAIEAYYAGNEALFITAKSSYGQLETAVPHLGAMGLFIMVTGHFLLFAPKHTRKGMIPIFYLLFIAVLGDIFSGFFIAKGIALFIWIKLLSFVLLVVLGFFLVTLVLKASYLGFITKSSIKTNGSL